MRRIQAMLVLLVAAALLAVQPLGEPAPGPGRPADRPVRALAEPAGHPPRMLALRVDPAPALAPGRATAPAWPTLAADTSDRLLAGALTEIHRLDPAGWRRMRREAPAWRVSLCTQGRCLPDVQGETMILSGGVCASWVEVTTVRRAARRLRLPVGLWAAEVLLHEHGHCNDMRDEYDSLAAQRRFLETWPAGPARDRVGRWVDRAYLRLDASGNWQRR